MRGLFIFLFSTGFVFIQSCSKEEPSIVSSASSFIEAFDYYELLTSESDGSIFVISSLANFGYNDQNESKTYIRTSANEKSVLAKSDGLVFRDDFSLRLNNIAGAQAFPPSSEYESVFGKDVNVNLIKGGADKISDISFYSPEIIRVQASTYPLELDNQFELKWNGDSLNSGFVYIILNYTPFENERMASDYPDKVINYIAIEDDGSEVIDRDDFPDIPAGSIVTVTLIRGVGDLINIDFESETTSLTMVVSSATSGYANFFDE